jgi:hypothetical protein
MVADAWALLLTVLIYAAILVVIVVVAVLLFGTFIGVRDLLRNRRAKGPIEVKDGTARLRIGPADPSNYVDVPSWRVRGKPQKFEE